MCNMIFKKKINVDMKKVIYIYIYIYINVIKFMQFGEAIWHNHGFYAKLLLYSI